MRMATFGGIDATLFAITVYYLQFCREDMNKERNAWMAAGVSRAATLVPPYTRCRQVLAAMCVAGGVAT